MSTVETSGPTDHRGTTGPLDGISVIEVANWVAAPSACAIMSDLGARVIKIEP
jgi:crotonobetainyl-CoA:carnitine CoA-transferase CaiB-like acyl-CoA transferase